MSLDLHLLDAARAALLLGGALAAMPLLRRAPAATRRLVLALALGGALVVPAVSALAPAWRLGRGSSFVAPLREPFREPLAAGEAPVAVSVERPATVAPPAAARAWSVDPAAVLVSVWAAGALLLAARLAAGILRSRALVRRAGPAPSWSRAAALSAQITGLAADVRVTEDLDAPAVTGVIAPVVLVPRAGDGWSDERRVAVLLHELAHVRQRDCLVQIAAQLACALHWFDPLAWLAARRLRLERELSADDAVLAAGVRPSRYAEDLLAIAGVRTAPASTLAMAERSQLMARVTAVVRAGRGRGPVSATGAALSVAASAAALLAVACATPEAPARAPAAVAVAAPQGTAGAAASGSTIDPRLQRIADEELDRAVAAWHATAGVIVVLDPETGAILANAGRAGGGAADVGVGRAYVTGSTLKPVTLAGALEDGVVAVTDRFDCENGARAYGERTLHDAHANGLLTVPEMLAVSSNVGFAKVFDRMGGERLGRWLRRFHFGAAPAIPGAAAGDLPARVEDRSFEGAVLANGEQMTASPVQLAAAYAAFANGGRYVSPTLALPRAGDGAGEVILRPETARAVLGLLEQAVADERATGKQARVAGVRVAGKTGTADWTAPGGAQGLYASFVGILPADRPRYVILVGVESPRGTADGDASGGTVAAPAFARVAARALGG
jgi:beta-lactamase regulating signal transducer with metallopeptidase domain